MALFVPAGPKRFVHQQRGLRKLIDTKGVTALLFDAGTGKTATTLDYLSLLALKTGGEVRVLVVCPLVAVDTWVSQSELFVSHQVDFWAEALGGSLLQRAEALASRGGQPYAKPLTTPQPRARRAPLGGPRALHHNRSWAFACRTTRERPVTLSEGPGAMPADRPRLVIEVLNLDTFSSRSRVGSRLMSDVMLDAVRRFDPEVLVVDELHLIKGATSNSSKLLGRIGKHVKRRIGLTGTVAPHSPLDVFGQWRFLDPYAFGARMRDGTRRQATMGEFRDRFAIQGGWMGKEIIGFKNLDDMHEIMARNSLVVRKEDALDLPPTTDVVVPVNLSAAELKAYADMKDQLATMLASGQLASATNRLTQMLRLRQITSGYLPDDLGQLNQIGTSKADTIRSLVHDSLAGEKRIVVFALFTLEIRQLVDSLTKPGTTVEVIDGSTPGDERRAIRKRFGSLDLEPNRVVLVCQIKTMSLAVNELVTANHAIFASLSQQRADFVQAQARLDRQGQTRPVTFWLCVAPQTVDEVVLKAHREQSDVEAAILQHIKRIDGR